MNDKMRMTKEDIEKYIEFLNFGAKHMKLTNPSWDESIEFVRLLTYQQQVLLPKLQFVVEQLEKQPQKEPEKKEEKKPVRKTRVTKE